uniref:Cytochrome b561 domain-containing protein n=1 Tax=Anopheles stephensi TaxID=30069 RepID=A0A182Y687_ANOST
MDSLYTWHVLLTGIGEYRYYVGSKLFSGLLRAPLLDEPYTGCCSPSQYINREMKHKHHVVSVHSAVGLASVVLVGVGLVSGLVALYGRELRSCLSPLWLYRWHRAVGVVAFSTGLVSLTIAYDKHIFADIFSAEMRIFAKIVTAITGLISLFGTLRKTHTYLSDSCNTR